MASFIIDDYISSSPESITSVSHERSLYYSSDLLITRSTASIDPSYHRPSHSKASYQSSEAQSTNATGPEDLMQKKHTHLREDQRDDWITKATVHSSKIGTNDPGEKSVFVGEATGQASKDQPRESKSLFDRLQALPEDRQYIMQRFLAEESHQQAGVFNNSTQGLSCSNDKIGGTIKHPPPRGKQASLDPNLLMIGAFTEDFDEYEIPAHRYSVSSANSVHSTSTDHHTLKPEALTKEYLAYESYFDKPQKKPNELENCTNSFEL